MEGETYGEGKRGEKERTRLKKEKKCTDLRNKVFFLLHSDTRSLADHNDTLFVGHVKNLLCVGIMRSPEAVASQPFQQPEISRHQHVVVPFPPEVRILVLSNTPRRRNRGWRLKRRNWGRIGGTEGEDNGMGRRNGVKGSRWGQDEWRKGRHKMAGQGRTSS